MPYQPLLLRPKPGPRVGKLIRRLEDHYFRDVHAMLRLPLPDLAITPACNFAIVQVLAAVVSGVSVTLYKQSGSTGSRFRDLLFDHYPWSAEPATAGTPTEHAKAIYSLVRNPLTHDLGLDLERKHRARKVLVKRLGTDGGRGLPEHWIEGLERGARPSMSPTITIEPTKVVLLVEAFYWGVRRMLQTVATDGNLAGSAETFLQSLEKTK